MIVLSQLSHPLCLSCLSCPCCHVLAILSPVPFLAELSWVSPLAVLSCPACPVGLLFLPVLSQLSCSIALVPSSPVPTVWSLLSCPGIQFSLPCPVCLVKVDLSGRPLRIDCLGCAVQCPRRCHVMPQLYCHGCPATVVRWQFSCPNCPHLLSCTGHPVLSFLSCLYYSAAVLPQHSCPQLFCPCCPVFVVMFSLPSLICFVLHALS